MNSRWAAVLSAAFAAAVLAGLLGSEPRPAAAHPLGNFTINRYARLELYATTLRVHYVLDFAELPALQLLREADSDGDGETTQAELDVHLRALQPGLARRLSLRAAGSPLSLTPVASEISTAAGDAGLRVVRAAIVFDAPSHASAATAVVEFKDSNYAGRAGWREIVVRPSAGVDATVDPSLLVERSDELRSYPAEDLRSMPDMSQATFAWRPGAGAEPPPLAAARAAPRAKAQGGFAALLSRRQSSAIVLLSLLAAFGFGMFHALGPGHGKTVVAGYLVGTRGSPRHALALGLTVTATHTASVYALGAVTLAGSAWFAPDRVYLYLGVAAGLAICAMGTALLVSRGLRALRGTGEGVHRHGLLGRPHAHGDGHHEHSRSILAPQQLASTPPARTGWSGVLALGVAGGLVPCPSAIVVMLAAISVGQVVYGMLLIVAFSAGLAGVLTAVGLALVLGRRVAGRGPLRTALAHPLLSVVTRLVPLGGAAVILAAGLGVTFQAMQQSGL